MKRVMILFVLLAVISTTICLGENTGNSILILMDETEFKSKLVEGLIKAYKDNCTFNKGELSELEELDTKTHSVVIIMDENWAGTRMNAKLNAFLERKPNLDNVVLLITAGDEEWVFEHDEIDAITSASEPELVPDIIEKLVVRIDAILDK